MKLNCVVVDDSSLQRMVIAKLVNNHPNLHLVGDFSNAIEAKNCMTVHTVDLIFLDVEMPGMTGVDLVKSFKAPTFRVVFVTAYDAYALEAFRVSAIDYLLKPINITELKEALIKAIKNIDSKKSFENYRLFLENFKKLPSLLPSYLGVFLSDRHGGP